MDAKYSQKYPKSFGKLPVEKLSFLPLLLGLMIPSSAFSQSANRFQSKDSQKSILLVQTSDYRAIRVKTQQEASLGEQEEKNFNTTRQQLATLKDKQQIIQVIQSLTSIAQKASTHYSHAAEFGTEARPYFAYVGTLTAWDTILQVVSEKSKTFVGYSEITTQLLSAVRAGDRATIPRLLNQMRSLDNQIAKLNGTAQAVDQYASQHQNTTINNAIIMQSESNDFRCLIDGRPIGSESEVSSQPWKYCNSR